VRTVGVKLTADVTGYVSGLQRAKTATADFKGQLDKAAKKGNLDKVAETATGVGLALVGMAGYAIKSAADFDKSMSSVSAATHAPKSDIEALRKAALQAGKDTSFSATQAADGITELSKAGVSTANVLNGGLKGALALAAAGQLSVGEAAETAASAMTQFKLKGDQIPHVADLLAAGAGKAQGSVHDMGYALNQSGLVASQFGLSIEDTVGTLAEFASAGLVGSDAGTSFRTMLISMANPSKVTAAQMQALGLSFYDAQGKFIGISGVADELRNKLGGLSDEQRQQALAQIFGNDALRAASILYADGSKKVDEWKGKVNDAGYASDTAARQTNNLAGDIERLKGSLETFAIQAGSGGNGGLRALTKGLNDVVDQFVGLPPAVGSAVTILAGLGGGAALGLAAWVKLRKGIADAAEQLAAMGPAGEKAAGALGKVASVAGKATVVFAALEAVQIVADHFGAAAINVDQLTSSLTNFANTGKTAGTLNDTFGAGLADLGKNAQTAEAATHGFWGGLNDLTSSIPGVHAAVDTLNESIFGLSFNKAKDNMSALNDALVNYMTTTGDAKKSSDLWNQVLTQSGLDTQQLAGLLPDAYKKLTELNAAAEQGKGAMNGQAGATKGTAAELKGLAKAATVATDENGKYKSVADAAKAATLQEGDAMKQLAKLMREQADPVYALIEAQKNLKKAQADETKAIHDHGKESSQARAATQKLVEAALDLQGAVGDVGADFNGKLDPALRNSLKAAGLTKTEINILSGEFKKAKSAADQYNGKYEALTSAPGAPAAKKQLGDAHTAAELFDGNYKAKVSVTGDKAAKSQLADLLIQQEALKKGIPISAAAAAYRKNAFAEGGWTGPGSKYQPAGIVHADEFVINKDSRQKIESSAPGLLDSMNATGSVPGYAAGGQVWPFATTAAMTKVPSKADVLNAVVGSTSAGSGSLGAWILQAIGLTGVPANWAGPLRTLVMRESGGNPRAINLWDSNAKAGHPSMGLAQTIGPTFEHYRLHSLPDDPYNPVANLSAAIRYIESRYGTIFKVQQANASLPPKGYAAGGRVGHTAMATGGTITEPIFGVGRSGRTYSFGETGPERVIPGYANGGLVNVAPSGTSAATSARGSRLDTADAMLAAASAVAQLSAALKENGRTWSTATQKGRDNRSSLIAGVRAAQDAAKAKYDETGSLKAANKVYDDYIKQLDASMKKMGVNAKARKALIAAYSEKPDYDITASPAAAPKNSSNTVKMVSDQSSLEDSLGTARQAFAWTKPTFNVTTAAGRTELQQLFSVLSAAQNAAQSVYDATGNSKTASTFYTGYISQLKGILLKAGLSPARVNDLINRYGQITLQPSSNRWGGLYEHAAGGALHDAQIAGAGPTQYAWAEPETGGELFAPKNGNLSKTRSQVGWAVANWWGGQVNWGQGAGGSTSSRPLVIDATIPITLGAETITRQVRIEVDAAVGQIANASVYQTA
jgi:TP901 family phage tail tape measure protein